MEGIGFNRMEPDDRQAGEEAGGVERRKAAGGIQLWRGLRRSETGECKWDGSMHRSGADDETDAALARERRPTRLGIPDRLTDRLLSEGLGNSNEYLEIFVKQVIIGGYAYAFRAGHRHPGCRERCSQRG